MLEIFLLFGDSGILLVLRCRLGDFLDGREHVRRGEVFCREHPGLPEFEHLFGALHLPALGLAHAAALVHEQFLVTQRGGAQLGCLDVISALLLLGLGLLLLRLCTRGVSVGLCTLFGGDLLRHFAIGVFLGERLLLRFGGGLLGLMFFLTGRGCGRRLLVAGGLVLGETALLLDVLLLHLLGGGIALGRLAVVLALGAFGLGLLSLVLRRLLLGPGLRLVRARLLVGVFELVQRDLRLLAPVVEPLAQAVHLHRMQKVPAARQNGNQHDENNALSFSSHFTLSSSHHSVHYSLHS